MSFHLGASWFTWLLPSLALACSVSAVEDSTSSGSGATGTGGTSSSVVTATSNSGSGGGLILGAAGAPGTVPGDPGAGQGGAAVVLPPFDCAEPAFFPLRFDDEGNPLDVVDGAVEPSEVGAAGAPGDVGTGDLTVLLVFDKSGSMGSGWGGKSRWQAGSDAVLLGLDGILDEITLGGLFFPFDEEGVTPGCGVPPITLSPQIDFTTGRGFKENWIASACSAQPDGSTPLEHALAVADLAIESARERGLVKDRMRVLLVTDGEPTCEDDLQAIVQFPTKWFEAGIETLVIGLPGSEQAHDLLDQIAEAGGTQKHSSPVQVGEFEDEVYAALR